MLQKYVQLSRLWLADPQCIAPGRPGRPLTQRTMVAGGLTLMKNDVNNDA